MIIVVIGKISTYNFQMNNYLRYRKRNKNYTLTIQSISLELFALTQTPIYLNNTDPCTIF